MPVSDHPIAVTLIYPNSKITLKGFDVGEISQRAIAYMRQHIAAEGAPRIKVETEQQGAAFTVRKAIEDAIARER